MFRQTQELKLIERGRAPEEVPKGSSLLVVLNQIFLLRTDPNLVPLPERSELRSHTPRFFVRNCHQAVAGKGERPKT